MTDQVIEFSFQVDLGFQAEVRVVAKDATEAEEKIKAELKKQKGLPPGIDWGRQAHQIYVTLLDAHQTSVPSEGALT